MSGAVLQVWNATTIDIPTVGSTTRPQTRTGAGHRGFAFQDVSGQAAVFDLAMDLTIVPTHAPARGGTWLRTFDDVTGQNRPRPGSAGLALFAGIADGKVVRVTGVLDGRSKGRPAVHQSRESIGHGRRVAAIQEFTLGATTRPRSSLETFSG